MEHDRLAGDASGARRPRRRSLARSAADGCGHSRSLVRDVEPDLRQISPFRKALPRRHYDAGLSGSPQNRRPAVPLEVDHAPGSKPQQRSAAPARCMAIPAGSSVGWRSVGLRRIVAGTGWPVPSSSLAARRRPVQAPPLRHPDVVCSSPRSPAADGEFAKMVPRPPRDGASYGNGLVETLPPSILRRSPRRIHARSRAEP